MGVEEEVVVVEVRPLLVHLADSQLSCFSFCSIMELIVG